MAIKKLLSNLLVALIAALILGCSNSDPTGSENNAPALPTVDASDHLRPLLHFTPPAQWLNDPNGLVYYDGEYHLFYQHYPEDTIWGPMHWGHAVSTDLINWQHMPIALFPDEQGYIFSGGAVIDWHNTAGFGSEAMIAFFTYHNPDNNRQSQALAYSTDKGISWTKYEGNPIIPTPPNIRNFRDPKVFWYDEGSDSGHWVMLIAAGSAVLFYTSSDMLTWEPSGSFGFGQGSTSGVWETPDLFELQVDGGGETRWVLTVGVGDHAPAGGSGMQYFVGSFDGEEFVNENPKNRVLWADYGADFYAAQSWSDVPDGRRVWLAWMNNWQYATVIPTSTWRGAMTMPRELTLTQTVDGIRLVQNPIIELEQLRGEGLIADSVVITPDKPYVPEINSQLVEIVATIESNSDADQFGIRVLEGEGEHFTIGYSPKTRMLFTDRTQSGQVDFSDLFSKVHIVDYVLENGTITFHFFVDSSAIDLFVDGGRVTFSERVFPQENNFGIQFYSNNADVVLKKLEIYELKAANFYLTETAN